MLELLADKILSFRPPKIPLGMFSSLMFVLFIPLVTFFFISRKMNARAEPVMPGPRRLLLLAQVLMDIDMEGLGRSNLFLFFAKKMERQVVWLLRKADRLLPDVNTGRRLNFFVLLFIAFLAGYSQSFHIADKTSKHLIDLRDTVLPIEQASSNLWHLFASFWLFGLLVFLPIFLIRKNRELYLDVAALFILIIMSFIKLLYCWPKCCFGIPFPGGVYLPRLGTTVFPVQLLEFALYFLGSVIYLIYLLYAKSYKSGHGCAFCVILYMVLRFYVEHFRYHSDLYRPAEAKMIFGLDVVQIMCLLGCAIAIAWLLLLPLEKKLMDHVNLFVVRRLRKLAMKSSLFAVAADRSRLP